MPWASRCTHPSAAEDLRLKKVTVKAYEDATRSEGGHATILLAGLAPPKSPVVFRIRPLDAARRTGGAGGWIGGDHAPVAVTATEQGIEIVAGPAVTESEHLLPGTVVEIEVPACGVRGEFLWPNVAPPLRPRRKTIVVNKPRGAPRTGRSEAFAGTTGVLDPGAVRAVVFEGTPSAPGESDTVAAPGQAPEPSEPAAEASPRAGPAEAEPGLAQSNPASADGESAAAGTGTGETEEVSMIDPKPDGARADVADPQHAAEEIANKHGWAFRKDVNVMMSKKFFALGASRHDEVQSEAVATAARSSHHNIAAEANAIIARSEETAASTLGADTLHYDLPPPEPYQPEMAHHAGGGVETFYPHERGSIIAPAGHAPRPGAWNRSSVNAGIAAALGTLVVGGIAAAALLNGPSTIPQAGAGSRSAAATAPAAAGGESLPVEAVLFEALSVGATSPRGTSATGISAGKALENANVQLFASGAARDTEEGAFWLKHYIAGSLSDDRTMRVLTQLGSVYAEPQGRAPDYAKARLLWEIASAAGDPVAMCFLGLLYESGLGIASDKRMAKDWYERSKAKGGCQNVDESIARVSQ
jgi:hypothetical protein